MGEGQSTWNHALKLKGSGWPFTFPYLAIHRESAVERLLNHESETQHSSWSNIVIFKQHYRTFVTKTLCVLPFNIVFIVTVALMFWGRDPFQNLMKDAFRPSLILLDVSFCIDIERAWSTHAMIQKSINILMWWISPIYHYIQPAQILKKEKQQLM